MERKVLQNSLSNYFENSNDLDAKQMAGVTDKVFGAVIETLQNGLYSNLWQELKVIRNISERFLTEHNLYNDEEKQKIYYFASIRTLADIIYHNVQRTNDDDFFSKLSSSYTHLNVVMKYLGDKKSATHTEIAEAVNLQKNTLSNFMSRISKFELFTSVNIGRKKIYYINSKGLRFYNFICKSNTSEIEQDYGKIITKLLELITDEIETKNLNVDNIMIKLNKENLRLQNISKSYVIRNQIRNIFSSINRTYYPRAITISQSYMRSNVNENNDKNIENFVKFSRKNDDIKYQVVDIYESFQDKPKHLENKKNDWEEKFVDLIY